jgi:recombination associated protein RdgC
MFFRNLTFFRFPLSLSKSLAEPDALLADAALKPVGPMEMSSSGFVSPFGRDEPALSHRVGDCVWITIGGGDQR